MCFSSIARWTLWAETIRLEHFAGTSGCRQYFRLNSRRVFLKSRLKRAILFTTYDWRSNGNRRANYEGKIFEYPETGNENVQFAPQREYHDEYLYS
jgi:hypothetical protein